MNSNVNILLNSAIQQQVHDKKNESDRRETNPRQKSYIFT
jgi:hypothetical protein